MRASDHVPSYFYHQTENLALKKPTAQSSTYCHGDSRLAVNGDHFFCIHTNEDNPSWWRVDLGSDNVPVFEVHIVNTFSNHPAVSSRNEDYKITVGTYLSSILLTRNKKMQILNNYSTKVTLSLSPSSSS